jgi:hypothetical protein
MIRVGIPKKALRKEPPTTLPQFLQRSLFIEENVEEFPFQYQSIAFPATQKLTLLIKNYMHLLRTGDPK